MSTYDHPVVLTPGKAGVLLADNPPDSDGNAPVITIINSGRDRVFIGDDYGVGPGNGIPLDGGTSLPWNTAGQVWAVADPAAGGTVTVIASQSIEAWQPSPYTVAAATAAQLLATGVPNVLVEDVIVDDVVLPAGDAQYFAIDRYAAVSVLIFAFSGAVTINATQEVGTADVGDGGIVVRSDVLKGVQPTPPTVSSTMMPFYRLSAEGDRMTLANTGNNDCTVRVIGTNRPASQRVFAGSSGAGSSFFGGGLLGYPGGNIATEAWSIDSQAYTANQSVSFSRSRLGDVINNAPQPFSQGGDADLYARLGSTTTVTSGQLACDDPNGVSFVMADTKEPAAFTGGTGFLVVSKRVFIPPGSSFRYVARTAGTVAVSFQLSYRS